VRGIFVIHTEQVDLVRFVGFSLFRNHRVCGVPIPSLFIGSPSAPTTLDPTMWFKSFVTIPANRVGFFETMLSHGVTTRVGPCRPNLSHKVPLKTDDFGGRYILSLYWFASSRLWPLRRRDFLVYIDYFWLCADLVVDDLQY
jgi:hypothetical protein